MNIQISKHQGLKIELKVRRKGRKLCHILWKLNYSANLARHLCKSVRSQYALLIALLFIWKNRTNKRAKDSLAHVVYIKWKHNWDPIFALPRARKRRFSYEGRSFRGWFQNASDKVCPGKLITVFRIRTSQVCYEVISESVITTFILTCSCWVNYGKC